MQKIENKLSKFTQLTSFLRRIHNDPLYRNSIYLIASQFVLAGLGFFFWVINARLFSASQIGLATTLISVTTLITSFSMMGFNMSSIRYIPEEEDKNAFVNTALTVVSIAAIVLTLIFLLGLPIFSPPLLFLRNNHWFMLFLVIFMVVSTVNAITDSIFIAFRSAVFILLVDIAVGLVKLSMPLVLRDLGSFGIFYAYVAAVFVGAFLSLFFLRRFNLKFFPALKKSVVRKVWGFSFGNYVAGLVGMLNGAILPILITNSLGAKITAYYYMPTMILSLVQSFPRSVSSSMFAEGSRSENEIKKLFFRSLKGTYSIMIPTVIIIMFLGQYILLAFGKSYSSEGITYLRIALVALLISAPNYLLGSILSIKKKVGLTMLMSVFGAVIGISLTLLLLPYGLTGLGIASVLGQFIMFFIYLSATYYYFREHN